MPAAGRFETLHEIRHREALARRQLLRELQDRLTHRMIAREEFEPLASVLYAVELELFKTVGDALQKIRQFLIRRRQHGRMLGRPIAAVNAPTFPKHQPGIGLEGGAISSHAPRMFRPLPLLALVLLSHCALAQDSNPLPEKLRNLTRSYEAAVQRATAPLTKTYVQELEKLKQEYTRSGNVAAATAADALMKAAAQPASTTPANSSDGLPASIGVEQFKAWLATVTVTELTGFKNTYAYDGKELTSKREDKPERTHPNATISPGKIFVPFTSTNATIVFDASRAKATVSYSTGERIEAKVEPKTATKK